MSGLGKSLPPPASARPRNTSNGLVQSASTSASVSYPLTNEFGRGIVAYFTIHTLPGSASTTAALKVQSVDPLTGSTYNLLSGAARSASGMTVLMVGPGISASALGVSALLPRDLKLLISLSTGATSKEVVYSIGYHFTS